MSRALRHVQRCLERQVQHSELNAFVTCAKATQLQDAANAIDDVEFDRMHLRPSSYSDTDKDRLSACGKNYCHQGQYRHERLSDHSIFKDPRRIQFAIQCDCGRQARISRCPDMRKDKLGRIRNGITHSASLHVNNTKSIHA
jgi:hypothetical protein